jgi:hypothetical protein
MHRVRAVPIVPPSHFSRDAQLFNPLNYGATDAELSRAVLSMTVIKSIHFVG